MAITVIEPISNRTDFPYISRKVGILKNVIDMQGEQILMYTKFIITILLKIILMLRVSIKLMNQF